MGVPSDHVVFCKDEHATSEYVQEHVWNVAAKPSELLHEFEINASSSICWVPAVFIAFQREMAKQNMYLDYSLDAWTQLQVLWPDDGQLYVARVMCWTDVN